MPAFRIELRVRRKEMFVKLIFHTNVIIIIIIMNYNNTFYLKAPF